MGKSTLLSNLAGVYSEVAAYEFTTLTTVPGVIRYKGAKIQVQAFIFQKCFQFIFIFILIFTRLLVLLSCLLSSKLLDLPGIIEGAKDGKGRGRQVIAGNCVTSEVSA